MFRRICILGLCFLMLILAVPALAASGGLPSTSSSSSGRQADITPEMEAIFPELNVEIPNFSFTKSVPVIQEGNVLTARIDFLAQYIAAIYKYLIAISIITAAVMLIWGGFKYIIGSSAGDVSSSKQTMQDALIGLVLIFCAWTIFDALNPATHTLDALDVQIVQAENFNLEVVPMNYLPAKSGKPEPSPGQPSQPSTPSGGGEPAFQAGSPPPEVPGGFHLPTTPGSKGWIKDGNCEFELNQGGVPTVLSTYKCAIEVVAKEEGINPCYLVTALGKETFSALTNVMGHDENPPQKISVAGEVSYFPERKKFLNSGVSYRSMKGSGGFTFTSLKENPDLNENRPNDDTIDLSKPDMGLDPRFSHGFGLGLTKVPAGCPINPDKRTWIQPYGSLKGAAQWIRCVLNSLNAVEDQAYNGTVFNVFQRWGGCYGPGGVAGKCVDYPKDYNKPLPLPKGSYALRGGYTYLTIACIQGKDPYAAMYKQHINICRGDLPLDRKECMNYVKAHLSELGISPEGACKVPCYERRNPVICVPNTNCAKLMVNPAAQLKHE